HLYNIHQLDLTDTNQATRWYKVAGMDTTSVPAFTGYCNIYPGPDNKLYIGNRMSGSTVAMSVINNPNAKGAACVFCPKCLRFPTLTYNNIVYRTVTSPPCMPNYKLGAASPPCTNDVAAVQKEEAFSIYPNPARTTITIEYEQAGTFSLLDMQGRVLISENLAEDTQKKVIDVNNLSEGVYLYTFRTRTGVKSGKVMIVR
ncbi:MAG: T9SS type A sorting domain-containing protein, partial [Sphingobacteriales bacterium]